MIFSWQSRMWFFVSLILFLFLYGCEKEVEALQTAPDFTLYDIEGKDSVTLSDFRGKKPVVLVFGSFT